MNVLVVDDSDVIRNMILKTLRLARLPMAVSYEAANGREALDILEGNPVDVVLADINMPVMDGLEMLKTMRENKELEDVMVVVVSTEAAAARLAELNAAGMDAYIRKPFTPEQIRDVVESVTGTLDPDDAAPFIREAFTDVLERFVLMFGEPADGEEPAPGSPDGELLQAHMTFRGHASGSLTLAASRDLCLDMAANAVGVDRDSPQAVKAADDALGEVLNMTCGCIAMAVDPEKAVDLTPPKVTRIDDAAWDALAADAATLAFTIEDRPALLSCQLRVRR
jgi:two-component system chemotaxis response regulator CheY